MLFGRQANKIEALPFLNGCSSQLGISPIMQQGILRYSENWQWLLHHVSSIHFWVYYNLHPFLLASISLTNLPILTLNLL